MKWLSSDGRQKRAEEQREELLDVPRRAFAWFPTKVGDNILWLESYSKVYRWTRYSFHGHPCMGIIEVNEALK